MEIAVIGEASNLRNPKLLELEDFAEVRFFSPVLVDESTVEIRTKQHLNRLVLGRNLLPGEVGCALAHRRIYETSAAEWTLILEDDASFSAEHLIAVERAVSRLDSRPAIIHLFDNQSHTSTPTLRRLFHRPSGTVAYIINRRAKSALTRLESIGTADWPVSSAGVRFYALWGLGITEVGGTSMIWSSSVRTSLSPMRLYLGAAARSPQILAKLGWPGLLCAFFMPLARDLSTRARRIKNRLI